MGRYDDMTPEQLRERLVRIARLVLKLDENDVLLARTPELLKLFGELRRMLFAYEVRCAPGADEEGGPPSEESDGSDEDPDRASTRSSDIVEEAIRRQQELQDELRRGFFPDDD